VDPRAALLLLPAAAAGALAALARTAHARIAAAAATACALAVALAAPGGPFPAPGLLTGALAGLDPQGRMALVAAGLVLLLAGSRAGPPAGAPRASMAWWALLAAGLATTAVAFDAATLALGFTGLVFGAYGIAHAGSRGRSGARAYLALALLGEVLLVDGLAELGHAAESPALQDMRLAAGAELGGAAMLLVVGAYGLPLALAGVGGPVLAVLALGVAALVGVLRVLPGPAGSPRDRALAMFAIAVVGGAAALVSRGLAVHLRARPEPAPARHPDAELPGAAGPTGPLAWMGVAESRLRGLTASGFLLAAVVILLYLVFLVP
jgi:hypothetical protein